MRWPLRQDTLTKKGVALGDSISFKLGRDFWLEAIGITLEADFANVASEVDQEFGLLKRARLSIADSGGNRKVIDCPGATLVHFWEQVGDRTDHLTLQASARNHTQGATTCTGYTGSKRLHYLIPIRHPQMADPWGAATCIPLPRLQSEPSIELEIVGPDVLASTFALTGSIVVRITLFKRDILTPTDRPHPYIPTELITYEHTWDTTAGEQSWDIPALGKVTGIMLEDHRGTNTSPAYLNRPVQETWNLPGLFGLTGASHEVSAASMVTVEYLSSVLRRAHQDEVFAANSRSRQYFAPIYPSAGAGVTLSAIQKAVPYLPGVHGYRGNFFLDFLTDSHGPSAFSLRSVLDMDPLARSGGRARIIYGNVAAPIASAPASKTRFTVHKLYMTDEMLQGIGGV